MLIPSVLALYAQVFDDLAREVARLDDAGCNWLAAEDGNTVATIVVHVVGSAAETLHAVAQLEPAVPRDRDAEFVPRLRARREILDLLEEATNQLHAVFGPRIDDAGLEQLMALPTLAQDDRRQGLSWLLANYGHARGHLGELQLTAQLYREARARARPGVGVRPFAG